MKYPNISSTLPDNFVQEAVEKLELSDAAFQDWFLEKAEAYHEEKMLRILSEMVQLTQKWVIPRYSLQNLEELHNDDLPEETHSMSRSD